jgi:hypothetical protein
MGQRVGRGVWFAAREQRMQKILRIWFLATGVFLAGAMIWAFAPVLVPIIGLTAAIGVLVAGIVGLARRIERIRGGAPPNG